MLNHFTVIVVGKSSSSGEALNVGWEGGGAAAARAPHKHMASTATMQRPGITREKFSGDDELQTKSVSCGVGQNDERWFIVVEIACCVQKVASGTRRYAMPLLSFGGR